MKKKNWKRWLIPLLSFLLPVLLWGIALFLSKIVPFGNNAILFNDLTHQYIQYFNYMNSFFTGSNDIFYTFSGVLGENMIGLVAYYLLSPFNLFFLILPKSILPFTIVLIVTLKIGCCGFTFHQFLKRFSKDTKVFSLLFSTAYALMGYIVTFCFHLMWLDALILLPLVLIGIEKIIKEEKRLFYILTLALTIITNYYIGFMVCLFSLLYFIYRLYCSNLPRKEVVQKIKIFISSSLLSGLLSAFILLPTIYSMGTSKAQFGLKELFHWEFNFTFLEFIPKLFTGIFNWTDYGHYRPHIFCTILLVMLALLYFLNHKIKKRDKIASAVFLLFLYLAMTFYPINIAFHLLNPPVDFPYREAFLFTTFVLFLAYQSWLKRDGISLKATIAVVILVATAYLFTFLNLPGYYFQWPRIFVVILDIVIILSGLFLWEIKKKRYAALLFLLICFDLVTNSYFTLHSLIRKAGNSVRDYDLYLNLEDPVTWIKEKDPGFYRMEFAYERGRMDTIADSMNKGMFFDYNGFNHYSSSINTETTSLLHKLGFQKYMAWVYYGRNGSTRFVDSLLGLKYLIYDQPSFKNYPMIQKMDHFYIFENRDALNIGYPVPSSFSKFYLKEENNLFENLNGLAKNLTGISKDLYTLSNNYTLSYQNLIDVKKNDSVLYKKLNYKKKATLTYTFKVTDTNPLYLYFNPLFYDATGPDIIMSINGKKWGGQLTVWDYSVLSLGSFPIGSKVTIEFEIPEKADKLNFKGPYFAYENSNVYRSIMEILGKEKLKLQKKTSSHLEGTVEVDKETSFLLTIPYDKSWSMKLDGEVLHYEKALEGLTMVTIPEGKHEIELKFRPMGIVPGMILSGSGLGILIITEVLDYKKRKQKKLT